MSLTLDSISQNIAGHRREHLYDVTFDSAYASGGEALTPEMVGLSVIEYVQVLEAPASLAVRYDRTNEKLLAMRAGGLTVKLVDGQNGGSDPTYTVSGGAVGDPVVFVGHLTTKSSIASLADVTADFAFTDDDELTDSGATDYSNDQFLVIFQQDAAAATSLNLADVTVRLLVVGY